MRRKKEQERIKKITQEIAEERDHKKQDSVDISLDEIWRAVNKNGQLSEETRKIKNQAGPPLLGNQDTLDDIFQKYIDMYKNAKSEKQDSDDENREKLEVSIEIMGGDNKEESISNKNQLNNDQKKATGMYIAAKILEDQGRLEEAIESYEKMYEYEKKGGGEPKMLMHALAHLSRLHLKLDNLEDAFHYQEKNFKLMVENGFLRKNSPQYRKAKSCLEELKKRNLKDNSRDKAFQFMDEGNRLVNRGAYQQALESYNKALEISPNVPIFWSNKGMVLEIMGKYTEALSCYNKGLELDDTHIRLWVNKGILYGKTLKDVSNSMKCLDRALELDPNHKDAWVAKGIMFHEMDKVPEALTCFDKALEINPKDASTINLKAAILGNQGKYEEVLQYNQKSIDIDPKNDKTWGYRGFILEKQGKFREAEKCYTNGLKYIPSSEMLKEMKKQVLQKLS